MRQVMKKILDNKVACIFIFFEEQTKSHKLKEGCMFECQGFAMCTPRIICALL